MAIDYERLTGVITRSVEVANEKDANAVVVAVFKEIFADTAAAYLAAEGAVATAMTAFAKENREALDALAALDAPYRVARSAVLAILPETNLPFSLATS